MPLKEFHRNSTIATMTPDEPEVLEQSDGSADPAGLRAVWPCEEGDFPKRCFNELRRGLSEAETAATSSIGSQLQYFEMMTIENSDIADSGEEEQEQAVDGDGDIDGIVIEGPLEQRNFLSIWRQRWCVLSGVELLVYRSQEASRTRPQQPKLRIGVEFLDVEIRRADPTQLVCYDASRGDRPVAVLRTGRGYRWEEWACAKMWLAKVASVI